MALDLLDNIQLRTRLLRRIGFRLWKSLMLSKSNSLIESLSYEEPDQSLGDMPALVLSSYSQVADLLVLSLLFREKDLTLVAPTTLPDDRTIHLVRTINHILYIDNGSNFRFFRQLLTVLRDLNRSVVISPEAAKTYAKGLPVDPAFLVRVAIIANVPIQPVVIDWGEGREGVKEKCKVFIGKRLFISPRQPDFKDIFFRRRGERKFSHLSKEEYAEVGERIVSKFNNLRKEHGTNLS